MGLRPLEIYLLLGLQCGDRLYSSESDVYRRQILTTKIDPFAVKLKRLSSSFNDSFSTLSFRICIPLCVCGRYIVRFHSQYKLLALETPDVDPILV